MSSARCEALLGWYREFRRMLPWRDTTEPYAIWISEIMLQQTQVKTVLPRYEAWFDSFPDIGALAAASLDEVLKAWEGLGYYRRARFLHAAARRIVDEHDGRFPDNFDDILKLPGIGRSTAGAIASFCFGMATPVLDGNVKRVLKRWHACPDANDAKLWPLAQQAIGISGHPADWNQAMMELGATICRPSAPDCDVCPLQAHCASAFDVAGGAPRRKKMPVRNFYWRLALHHCPERGLWLVQRPPQGIWAGLWTPPITELERAPEYAPCHIHILTHRRLHLYGVVCAGEPEGDGRWIADTARLALPTGIRRLLEKRRNISG